MAIYRLVVRHATTYTKQPNHQAQPFLHGSEPLAAALGAGDARCTNHKSTLAVPNSPADGRRHKDTTSLQLSTHLATQPTNPPNPKPTHSQSVK